MKAGFVTRVRVNPKDCLSLLDVVQQGGVRTEGMSFSAITSLAISCMLEALRKHGTIPTNDGFDFEQRMAPFKGGKSTYDKRTVTESLYVGSAAGLPLPEIKSLNPVSTIPLTEETRPTLWAEYSSLNDSFSTHTPEQRSRYKELERVFQQP